MSRLVAISQAKKIRKSADWYEKKRLAVKMTSSVVLVLRHVQRTRRADGILATRAWLTDVK